MSTFDATRAECSVFTYKDGLLSKIAHDLRVKVERFEVKVDGENVEATFDAKSLRVVCARKDGVDSHGTLSSGDRSKIESNIQKDVLETSRHPEIRFTGKATIDGDRATVTGQLTLHGTTRPLTIEGRREGGRWVGRTRLHQPDFGITPYSAMLGTLKIQPTVEVELSLPAD
ncbi:MAG: YceI family protein [Sandaracinus sp.]|nr:YceI family protein [Sandaracinus sp.]MCB9612994.1 YceI family protein [Sandaracinus sp.]MCB9619138.1 YceI family protein [Sandaracinus sp.]MCB9632721.1 YceI family protein [Sandaracinus sp.]